MFGRVAVMLLTLALFLVGPIEPSSAQAAEAWPTRADAPADHEHATLTAPPSAPELVGLTSEDTRLSSGLREKRPAPPRPPRLSSPLAWLDWVAPLRLLEVSTCSVESCTTPSRELRPTQRHLRDARPAIQRVRPAAHGLGDEPPAA